MSMEDTIADRRFSIDRATLIRRLREVLPVQALLAEEEEMRPYDCDGLTAYRQLPLLVALPEDEAQAQAVLKVCHQLQVPVVPRGAATGLSGGATPHPDGVLVSLAKLKRIIRVDPLSRTAVVQPGVRNLAVSEAAAPYGLYYAPDPSSQIACTIGGNVAENAGGVHCLKYGLTVHNVMRVRGLTIEGEIVEFGNAALDAAGYDLLALLNGSEGLLAMITEVTVKLTPKPELAQVVIASFDDVRKAGDAVASIIAAGIIPAGLEMMDKKAIHAVEPYVNAGYDMDAEAILLCESDGTPEEVAEEIGRMTAVLENEWCGRDSRLAERSRAAEVLGRTQGGVSGGRSIDARLSVHGRHDSQKASGRDARSDRCSVRKYALRCANVFHAGDGNLHPLIMYDANQPGELDRATAFGCRDPRTVGALWRHDHRRAWGGHREDRCSWPSSSPRPRSAPSIGSRRPSTSMGCSIPARACRRLPAVANIPRRVPAPRLLNRGCDGYPDRTLDRAHQRGRQRRRQAGHSRWRQQVVLWWIRNNGEALDVGGYRGIVAYEPTELVVTARAGTPLAELAATLAEKGQWLAFEPPYFGPAATVGGMLASGLSGPRRQAVGAVRDFVLGVKLLNGLGEVLSFGGQVMKNVAGYDVSRLLAGSLGTLGVVLEVSLKVLPLPMAEKSLRFVIDEATALQKLNQWGGRPLPISASAWHDGILTLRLSGAAAAVTAAAADLLAGEWVDAAEAAKSIGNRCASRRTPFLPATRRCGVSHSRRWRHHRGSEPTLIEWGGAQRWLRAGDATRAACGCGKSRWARNAVPGLMRP
jgi:glycolate oxidase